MNLLRWALWSRARLASLIAGTFVAMLFASMAVGALATTPAPTAKGGTPSNPFLPASSTTTASGGRFADGTPTEQVQGTATAFLKVWMHPKDAVAWADELSQYATPDVIAMAYAVDTTQIPRGRPRHVTVQDLGKTGALVRAVLPGNVTMYVGLELTDQGWRVTTLTGQE